MGHDTVPTDEPTLYLPSKKMKRRKFYSKKSFWICCSNVELRGGDVEEEKVKKKNEKGKEEFDLKLKKKLLLCCSNLEIETEEQKEKVLSYLENDTRRSRVVMCFSNLEVGPKSDVGHEAPK